jgi:hypothetical protein
MPQQLADDRQAKPTTCAKACIGVAEVMKAHAVEPGALRHRLPWTLQIRARLIGIITRHDIGAEPIEAGQDRKGRRVQNHRLSPRLGVLRTSEARSCS